LPHATSKSTTVNDLESIETLGFRGEALSSIAAVSQVEFVTKTKAAKLATKLSLRGGQPTKQSQGSNAGTTIIVKNLFYNTPARKKFLQSPNAEKNNVTTAVGRLILANPTVSFKYTIDGDTLYDYRGKTPLDAIQAVYGDGVANNLTPLAVGLPRRSAPRNDTVEMEGFVSKPSFTKRNRTYQTLIVNGRTVEGGIVADAVNAAFANYMTVGNFPFFVLNLTVDTREVDVNVHPRKAQIKFSNEQEIFDLVKKAVMEAVDKHLHDLNTKYFKSDQDTELLQRIKHFSSSNPEKAEVKSAPNIMNKYDMEECVDSSPGRGIASQARNDSVDERVIARNANEAFASGGLAIPRQERLVIPTDFKLLGTIFDTYILLYHKENFLIIDQHAAHERLLYDELKKQIDSDTVVVQRLLEPVVMVLNAQEMTKMETAVRYLNDIGFECQPFGTNCFRITAVPVLISNHGIETIAESILHDVKSTPSAKLSAVIQEKIISQCCKNSIKAGKSLNNEQIKYFLEQIGNTSGMHCPHGRPIIISYSKDQIEKMFARK